MGKYFIIAARPFLFVFKQKATGVNDRFYFLVMSSQEKEQGLFLKTLFPNATVTVQGRFESKLGFQIH